LELLQRARAIASDRDSGAAELVARLLPLLAEAVRAGGSVPLEVARVVLEGQPAMAPVWHACAAAVADAEHPGSFARAHAEVTRAREALARAASIALRDVLADESAPLVLTLSYSSSVVLALREAAVSATLRVVCGEGRPRFEGHRLAIELAQSGIATTVVVDAALTAMLAEATCVVMGADAVFGDRWINKVGSFGLAAAASLRGVPVYVIAARDKFVPTALAPYVTVSLHQDEDVWPDHPPHILTRNLYFEAVPAELATLILAEAGPIPPGDLVTAVERRHHDLSVLLSRLG
jgi:translation initiation factor 2B subunit (eIF-2B alpha/beta/delta family)